MATRTENPTRFESLVAALRPHAPDVRTRRRTAANLCAAGYGDRTLLGVLSEGEEAVYHSTRTRCVAVVRIEGEDPHIDSARPLGQAVDDPGNWLAHAGDSLNWAWLNPAMRG